MWFFGKYKNPSSLLNQSPVQVTKVPGQQVPNALQSRAVHNEPMQDSVSDRGGCTEVQLQLSQSLKVAFWTEQVEKLVLSVVG